MSDLRTRIARELMWVPSVVLPVVGGVSSWFVSWAVGSSPILNVVGLVGVIFGIGWFATRAIFYADDVAADIVRRDQENVLKAEEAKLEELQQRLRIDRDFRTKDYLTLLRTCRTDFEQIAKKPGIALQSHEIVKKMRQLFWSSIDQLDRSLKMFELSERLIGDQRKKVLEDRERVLAEISESIDHMQTAIQHYQKIVDKEQETNLDELQSELDASLRVAKRIEERMKEINGTYDVDKYLKE